MTCFMHGRQFGRAVEAQLLFGDVHVLKCAEGPLQAKRKCNLAFESRFSIWELELCDDSHLEVQVSDRSEIGLISMHIIFNVGKMMGTVCPR